MAQYSAGTASVTKGSAVVTGDANTAWSSNLATKQLFAIKGSGVWYEILSVDSDTQITLKTPYGQATVAGATYIVQRDFTPNNSYPTPTYGDSDAASLYAQSLLKIDADMGAISPVASILQGDVTLDGDIAITPLSVRTIGDTAIAIGEIFQDANGFLKIAKVAGGS